LDAGQEGEEGHLDGLGHAEFEQVRDVEDRRNGPSGLVDDVTELFFRRSVVASIKTVFVLSLVLLEAVLTNSSRK
jgi:hypothetical protein